MFGRKENDVKPTVKIASSSTNVTFLAEDCEVKGSFVSKGNVRIEGKIEGTVSVAGDLAIGQNAVLKANIEAQTISLAGEVRGNIKAKDLLELSSTARLYGDINTRQLKIDQGARFIGTSTYEEAVAAEAPKAALNSEKENKNAKA
ncbi:MAG: bactofilin family protein [Desulfitobacteriia bacterium]|jgi:cytoskeletal protein CcmA (bactofilin family)